MLPTRRAAGPLRLRTLSALVALAGTACTGTVATLAPTSPGDTPPPVTRYPQFMTFPSPTLAPAPSVAGTAAPRRSPTGTPGGSGRGSHPGSGPTIGGCATFPASNPWNQDISRAPLNPNSNAYVASINATRTFVHPDFGSDPSYGIPYVVVPGSQRFVPITFNAYGSESDPGPYPVPLNAPVEAGSDRHVLVVDSGNCHLYEMYAAQQQGSGWTCASGAVFNLSSNALRPDTWTSADAAGLPILPGLVRYDEVAAGVINHALRFTVQQTQNGFIHPATHQAGVNNANDPPMGLRLRLKASFDLSHFHGESLVILTALKKYGMIVADNGSSWFISGSTDSRWNDGDLNQMKTVPGSAFEAVQTGAIQRG